jgi:transcriptional regulator with PAS, ATPase and Fis domain
VVSNPSHAWLDAIPGAVTICDTRGLVLEMNEAAVSNFAKDGGRALVGRSLLDCHPEPARSKLKQLLETGATSVYTVEKNGVRKLVYQAPWYRNGDFGGLIEVVLPLPAEMPHFARDAAS